MTVITKLKRILDGRVPFCLVKQRIEGYVRDPSIWEEDVFNIENKEFYDKGIKEGLLSEQQAFDSGINKGIWKPEWDREKVDINIKKLHEEIHRNKFFVLQAAKLEFELKELEKLKKEQNEAYSKIIKQNTATYFALTSTIINKMERLIVLTRGEICHPDIYYTLYEIYEKEALSEEDIRLISRSAVWATMIKGAKEGVGHIFSDIKDLTLLQYSLLNWSNVYSYAYNSMNRPSDDVLENDILFDRWLKADLGKHASDNRNKHSDSKEIFIPSDKNGAAKVYEMNDSRTRSGIQARQKLIQEKGEISEAELSKKTNTLGFSTLNKKGEL
jgi:hypothetical protein